MEKRKMLKQVWRGRSKSPNSRHSYKNERLLESLAGIAVKYRIDSSEFFNCILEAWNNKEAECKQLVIKCRKRTKNSALFLFTNGRKVVAQFPIPPAILQENNQIEKYMRKMQLRRASSVKRYEGGDTKIKDLKAGMKKVSIKAKVLETPESNLVYTRYGTTVYVSNALIKDETGSIRMSLWNHQINKVHEGDVINIKNGKVTWFRGERQLRLMRNGNLRVIR